MISLTDREAVSSALSDPRLDPHLRAILGRRAWQLDTDRARPLGEVFQIFVVEPGDPAKLILDAVGFPVPAETDDDPDPEWTEDHGGWVELAYVLTDDFGVLVVVEGETARSLGVTAA